MLSVLPTSSQETQVPLLRVRTREEESDEGALPGLLLPYQTLREDDRVRQLRGDEAARSVWSLRNLLQALGKEPC